MYKNNTPYVSLRYEKQDYLNLNLSINSDKVTFDNAINIFIDRIQSRFLDQIHILTNDCNKNGFAIMALECLLVETFAQFQNGLKDTARVSKINYVDFLLNNLNCFPNEDAAIKFYEYIRCGILHQAQTKPYSGLSFGYNDAINCDNGFLTVSVDRFVEKMDTYFENYCNRLHDTQEVTLRTNFVKKMDYICRR